MRAARSDSSSSSAATASERGAAVIVALLATVLLNAIGLGLIAFTNTEVAIAANYREASETLYAAEAAADCAVSEVLKAASWDDVLSGLSTSVFRDATLVPALASGESLNLSTLTASMQAASDAGVQRGADNPRWRLFLYKAMAQITRTANSRAYAVAWVADDATETDGNPLVDGNGIVVIRAQAVARLGHQRTIEVVVAKQALGMSILSWREIR